MLANPEWETKQLLDLGTPSLRALSIILRDRKLWPKKFRWFYGECESCAMGLAKELWSEHIVRAWTPHMCEPFDIDRDKAQYFFIDSYNVTSDWKVTPEMIADRIDEYLASKYKKST